MELGTALLASAGVQAGGSILGGLLGGGESESERVAKYAWRFGAPYRRAARETFGDYQEKLLSGTPTMEDILGYARTDPGLQFEREQGLAAIEGSAAARGNLLSGNTMKSLMEYGQGLASQGIDRAYNRQMALREAELSPYEKLYAMGRGAATPPAGLSKTDPNASTMGAIQGVGGATQGLLSNFMLANMAGLNTSTKLW